MRSCGALQRGQQGVALFTALLVVALATVLAVEMIWSLSLNLRRTESLLSQDQARQFALGAEAWAREILADDDPEVDHLDESWAQRLPPLLIEGGLMEGHMEDAQGRFDLNALVNPRNGEVDPAAYEQLQRLLEVLELDPALADAVVDWIDPDQVPGLQGAEDDAYTRLQPPYRAANTPFVSPTELLAVQGFDAEIYATLAPHITALPLAAVPSDTGSGWGININTATDAVLLSLDPTLTLDQIEAAGDQWPFDSPEDFLGQFFAQNTYSGPPVVSRSGYFHLIVTVTVGSTRVAMYSLLERTPAGVVPRLRTFDTD